MISSLSIMPFLKALLKSLLNKSVLFPQVKQDSPRGILLNERVYQNEEQWRKQFYAVYDFKSAGDNGKFIKWSDILDSV